MSRRSSPFGVLSSAVLAFAAIGLDSPAQAECIAQPNQQAPEGDHWSLHSDHAKNRRCWILVDASGHEVEAPPPQPAPAPASVTPFQSFLDNFTGGMWGSPSPPSQDPPTAAPVTPPPHRVARVRPPASAADHKGDPAAHEMTPEERDRLFQDFLRWHEKQPSK